MFDSFVIGPIKLIIALTVVVALFGTSEQAQGVATSLVSLVFVDVLPTVVGAFIDAAMQLSPFGGGGGGAEVPPPAPSQAPAEVVA